MKVWKQLLAKSGQSLVVSEEATEATADPLTTGNIPNLISTVDKVSTSIISIIMCLYLIYIELADEVDNGVFV